MFFCDQAVSLPSFDCPLIASLKSSSCLSKTAQTWRAKPANSSDLVRFSGKSFRHGEKIRLHKSAHETNLGFKSHVTKGSPEKCKESVFWIQILCRNQANPQILWCYQANVTDSLQKSGALSPSLTDRLLFSKRRTSRLAHHTRSSARSGALGPGSTGQLAFQCTRPDMLLSAQRMQENHRLTCNFLNNI